MSITNTFRALQENLDLVTKTRAELRGDHTDGELTDRVANTEKSLYQIFTRLDKIEAQVFRKSGGSNVDDALSSAERTLREAIMEMVKQQNTIERLRQEIDDLKRSSKSGVSSSKTAVSSTTSVFKQQPQSIPIQPQPQLQSQQLQALALASKTSNKRPPPPTISAKPPNKQTTATKQKPRDDGEHSSEEEEADHAPPVQLPVEFPPGYSNRGRRFSVFDEPPSAAESKETVHRNITAKPEEVKKRIRSVITNNILMKNLEEDQIEELIDEMFEVRLAPDDVIIRQGDPGDNFYVVDNGELYILYRDVVVATIGSGKSFGEIALMYNCPRTATVRAKSDCILWGMSRTTFRRCLMEDAIRKRKLYDLFLSKVPLLEGLLPYERSIISDALELRTYRDGDMIIRQNDKGDNFYILERGKAVVTKNSSPEVLKVYKEGDYFGELALLTDKPRAANVVASGNVRVLCLSREDFSNLQPCEEVLKRNAASYLNGETPAEQSKPATRPFNVALRQFNEEEASYNKKLNTIVKDYLKPLRVAASNRTVELTDDEVAALFQNVEMILNLHNIMAQQLATAIHQNAVGEVFNKASLLASQYSDYLQGWKQALQTYEDTKSVESFQKFLKTQPNDLINLLQAPVTRYNQILTFLKEVQSTSSDPLVSEAVKKFTAADQQ